jgi:hypothetical protein
MMLIAAVMATQRQLGRLIKRRNSNVAKLCLLRNAVGRSGDTLKRYQRRVKRFDIAAWAELRAAT